MAAKGGMTDKERAVIEAARRELAAGTAGPAPAKTTAGAAVAQAARIAALMAAERAETERRRNQIRRWGIHVPLILLAAAVLAIALQQLR